jgi:hypothetical protein
MLMMIKRIIDNRTLSPGIKRPGREADHSTPSGPEVKNAWSYSSTPPNVFMTWCSIKHRISLNDVVLDEAQG